MRAYERVLVIGGTRGTGMLVAQLLRDPRGEIGAEAPGVLSRGSDGAGGGEPFPTAGG